MTETLHDLRASLTAARETYGRRSSQAERAFSELCRTAAAQGTPLDALRHHVADEVERFFSYTIPGPDGHVYWDGPKYFRRNDNRRRTPLRWWWQHHYGNLADSDDLVVKCGEKHCVNPEHAAKERVRGVARRFSDDYLIGSLQVLALRLGRTPTTSDWRRAGRQPSEKTFSDRFGSWPAAIRAAGLNEARNITAPVTPERCLDGIRFAHDLLGHWPSWDEYVKCGSELKTAGLPSTISAAMRIYGSWPAARKAAGGPGSWELEGRTHTDTSTEAARQARARKRKQGKAA
jgi:hypothetical protein